MSITLNPNTCPKCGAAISAEAPQGLCPKCVLAGAATATDAGLPPTATAEIPSLARVAAAFPHLDILELIGRGGMGFVFKARQPHLDRFVALKLLPDKLAHDPQFAERFNREGRVLAKLNHPNIVGIFDFGQTGGFCFLLMEYVDGVNLRQAMRAGKFSPAEALSIVPKICEALQYAHEQGVLHRDIKPENILLDARGRVKIADFGIAKLVGEDQPDLALTATGAAMGTVHYMAPEQLEKPGTVDHRADIYSLGVVFYEMLTGELPIGRFSPPSQRTPLDPRVDDVVMRTLEKEREKRFQSAGEMKTNVEHLTGAGAGSFKSAPPKSASAEIPHGPGGTIAINPSAVIPPVPAWSLKAVWGAVLVGISLVPAIVVLIFTAFGSIRLGGVEVILILASLIVCLPCLIGTILGWIALRDIRAHQGRLRGLPLAVFAALAWPVLVLLVITLILPFFALLTSSSGAGAANPLAGLLVLLVPAGTLPFTVWAVYAVARWGANQPMSQRRGVLKWIFLGVMASALGFVLLKALPNVLPKSSPRQGAFVEELLAATPRPGEMPNVTTSPWIRFTFTAVELREAAGVRWLAIDYLDDVHGDCQKTFPWETWIPGLKSETRTVEFFKESKESPPVRHQRIEFRLPDSVQRWQLEKLRDDVAQALNQKAIRLEMGEEKVLFELFTPEGGPLKARVKVVPPVKTATEAIASSRKLELHIPTITDDPYRSVGVTTDSELPVGDYLVGLLQRPDGRVEELPVTTTIYAGLGPTRVMRHLIWSMSQFESNRVRELAAAMRTAQEGRVVELAPDERWRVFQATNDHGGVNEGFIALRSQNLPVSGLPPVSVSIVEVPSHWPYFLSVKLRVSAPAGYLPNAVGLRGDGSRLETHTSIGWSGDSCYWYFPREFIAGDVQEIIRQLESTKAISPNGIRILPGQRVPVFSVTNQAGSIFRGYFELPMTTGMK